MKFWYIKSKNKDLCKTFSDVEREGYNFKYNVWVKDYDKTYLVDLMSSEFNVIEEFYVKLKEMTKKINAAIIAGRSITGKNEYQVLRRSAEHQEGISIEDFPQDWVCLDVDSGELPLLSEKDIPEAIVQKYFPDYLKDVDYVFQFSNSSGFAPLTTPKGHFWILLSEPRTCAELQKWQKMNRQFDSATLKAAQPIYTSNPKLHGLADPIKERIVLVKKDKRSALINVPSDAAVEKSIIVNCPEGVNDWRVFLYQITPSNAHPHVVSATTSFYVRFGNNGDWAYFKSAVLGRMREVGHARADANTVSKEIDAAKDYCKGLSSFNLPMNNDLEWSRYKLANLTRKG